MALNSLYFISKCVNGVQTYQDNKYLRFDGIQKKKLIIKLSAK